MKHNLKAALKKLRYGVYVYGNDVLYAPKGQSKYTDSQTGRVYTTDIEDVRPPHAVMTHIREKKINDILSSIPSGINNSVLIIAPYSYSVLSALLLLKTDDPSCITYTVKGIRGSSDLTLGESGFSTLHRVPIVGLFEDTVNTVILHCRDKNSGKISDKKISIKMPNVLKNYDNISIRLTKNNRPITADEERFYAVSGGNRGSTCIIDSHANVRGFLARKPQYYGIYHLDNGRFLFAEHFFKRPTFGVPLSVVTHEMDWLGRHHHTYLHERGYHHHAEVMDDGSFLTLSSSFYDTYVENQLIRIDRKTGEEIYTLSMNELFDDTYKTRNDWCHINCISKTKDPNEVVVCMRNIHTIAKIDLANKKLIWIFANPKMYEGTAQEALVLKPEGDIDPWFFQQHAARVMDNYKDADPDRLYISFYDNHDTNRRPVDWYDGPGTSYGLVVSVDEKNKTVRLEKRFPTYFTATRANTVYDERTDHYYTMDARLAGKTDDAAAYMREWDFETGELIREYSFNQDFFAAYQIEFDYDSLAAPVDPDGDMLRGKLEAATVCDTPEAVKIAGSPEDDEIRFCMYGDNFCGYSYDKDMSELLLVGDKVTYHVDFEYIGGSVKLTQPIKTLTDSMYWRMLPLKDVPAGRYECYCKYKGIYYKVGRYIEIKETSKKPHLG